MQRCAYTEIRGGSRFQCRNPDPHIGRPHYLGIDAEVYGRDLDKARPEWLAAQLRDKSARERYLEARIEQLTAIAADLSAAASDGASWVRPETREWVARNAPTAAARLGWAP